MDENLNKEESVEIDPSLSSVESNLLDIIEVIIFSSSSEIGPFILESLEKNKIKGKLCTTMEEFSTNIVGSYPKVAILEMEETPKLEIFNLLNTHANECFYLLLSKTIDTALFPYCKKANYLGYMGIPVDINILLGLCKKKLELSVSAQEESRLKYQMKSGKTQVFVSSKISLLRITPQEIFFESNLNFTKGGHLFIKNSPLNEFLKTPQIELIVKNSHNIKGALNCFEIQADFSEPSDEFLNYLRNFINTEVARLEELDKSKKEK